METGPVNYPFFTEEETISERLINLFKFTQLVKVGGGLAPGTLNSRSSPPPVKPPLCQVTKERMYMVELSLIRKSRNAPMHKSGHRTSPWRGHTENGQCGRVPRFILAPWGSGVLGAGMAWGEEKEVRHHHLTCRFSKGGPPCRLSSCHQTHQGPLLKIQMPGPHQTSSLSEQSLDPIFQQAPDESVHADVRCIPL